MLLSLSQWLLSQYPEQLGFLRVIQFLTFRAVLAAMTALLIGLAFGPWVIRRLAALKIGQPIREYGVQAHIAKAGTPTMGGVLVLIGIGVSTLLWFDWSNRFVWIVMLVTFGFGTIGWVDDWRKVVHKNPEGMRSREKYFWQSVIGLVAAFYLCFAVSESSNLRVFQLFMRWIESGFSTPLPPNADLLVPFFKTISYPLGVWGFIILTYLVIVGSSNAVNLTDGLDGLAIMPVVMVGSALGVFAYVVGNSVFSKYLLFPYIPGAGELLIFCAAMAGAGPGLPLVQRLPGAGVHGRRRCARARRRAGHDRRHHAPGDRARDHGWHLRRRGAVGDAAGQLVQVDQAQDRHRRAVVQDGAAAPPLRGNRLARDAGRGALLDHHDAALPGRPGESQTAMNHLQSLHVLVLGLGESGLAMATWCASHGATVRVWDSRHPAPGAPDSAARPPQAAALALAAPQAVLFGGALQADALHGVQLVLKSPGLAPHDERIAPLLAAAKAQGVAVQGELDLFARALADLQQQRDYAPT